MQDRRRVSPLFTYEWLLCRQRQLELVSVVRGLPRHQNLGCARIQESPDNRVEVWVGPDPTKFSGADPIGPGRDREIYRIAQRRNIAVPIKLAAARRRHNMDSLLGFRLASTQPYDWDAVEIGANRIVCASWVLVTAYPEIWPLLA